jgi:formate dehydrogenase subunit gamma
LIGPDAFALITQWGKYAHNYLSFAFMLGLILIFVLWVKDNIPNRHDLVWLSKGGGLFKAGVHPPSEKFNAGQKLVFWIVILGGVSISLSGIALLFPFEFKMFAATNAFLNIFGFDLPTNLTLMQEMQLSQLWHGIVAIVMIAVVLAHIYIGSLGMEGAFDAMGTGMVDENWAREHHDLWVAEIEGRTSGAEGDD